ncbi:MAG: hypothetical protein AB2551_16575 [Candidatus Thiodiazotropha sp.]
MTDIYFARQNRNQTLSGSHQGKRRLGFQAKGESTVIACIEDQAVVEKILKHLQTKGAVPPLPDMLSAAWMWRFLF